MQNCSQQGPSLILSSFKAAWVFRARILEFRALESSVLELPGVKYRMLHIPGILDCTYHLHVSCLCAQGSSIAEYLDYSP